MLGSGCVLVATLREMRSAYMRLYSYVDDREMDELNGFWNLYGDVLRAPKYAKYVSTLFNSPSLSHSFYRVFYMAITAGGIGVAILSHLWLSYFVQPILGDTVLGCITTIITIGIDLLLCCLV